MAGIKKLIKQNFPDIKYETGLPMKHFSFVRTGGEADHALFPKNLSELDKIICLFKKEGIGYCVLGKCSNVLFSDKTIKIPLIKTDYVNKIEINGNKVYAECGAGLCHLAVECLKVNLSGFEYACGIPGSLGGGIAMNAGAYGESVSDNIARVYISGEKNPVEKKDCGFAYRNSRFLNSGECVLAADFELVKGDKDVISAKISENTTKRIKSQPKGFTLGSTFKNPEKKSAGKLIESCRLKGFGIGGAIISEKHANFIMNMGGAASSDIKKLIDYIKDTVFKLTNILLEEEIRYIGEF